MRVLAMPMTIITGCSPAAGYFGAVCEIGQSAAVAGCHRGLAFIGGFQLDRGDMFTLVVPALLNRGRYESLVIDRDYIKGSSEGHAVPDYDKLLPWIKERFVQK